MKTTALSIGYGGFETAFEVREGKITEKAKTNNTSAYMLVYIREGEKEEIMRELDINEIPKQLKDRFDEENEINQKLDKDFYSRDDCSNVYVIS